MSIDFAVANPYGGPGIIVRWISCHFLEPESLVCRNLFLRLIASRTLILKPRRSDTSFPHRPAYKQAIDGGEES